MKNSKSELGRKAVEWWCPDDRITDELIAEVDAELLIAQTALNEKDWSTYHTTLNRVAASPLGYDNAREEESLTGYLDDLVRGYIE